MNKEDNKWVKGLKERLSEYSEPVGNDLWNNIEHSVKRSLIVRRRNRILLAASVVAIIGLTVGIVGLRPEHNAAMIGTSATTITVPVPVITFTAPIPLPTLSTTPSAIATTTTSPILDSSNNNTAAPSQKQQAQTNTETTPPEKQRLIEEAPFDWSIIEQEELKEQIKRASKRGGVSLAMIGSFNSNIDMNFKAFALNTDESLLFANEANGMSASTIYFSSVPTSSAFAIPNKLIEYNYKHHTPLSFGLSVRKNVGKRVSFDAGISTTMTRTSVMNGSSRIGDNTMWYIGIPVKANWNFLTGEIFEMYLSMGGSAEKCIFNRYTGKGLQYTNGKEAEFKSELPFQFSVGASIGAQLNLSKTISLFIEPGASYFFKTKETFLPNVRSEYPLNFNLLAGLRLRL